MNELPITQVKIPPERIDLGMGIPELALLPLEALQASAETFFAAGDARPLQYGTEQGNGYFRRALADFLTGAYGAPVDPTLLFVTAGVSSALDLVCSLYTKPGDTILVEEPTYYLALRIFEDHGLKVIPLPMDAEGLALEGLEEKITRLKPKLLYTIPTFQNPSGLTLPLARREFLLKLAERHNFLIVADEVYHLLPYTQIPPKPFAGWAAESEQVISLNSFSKILAPGLRLGWVQAHETIIKRLAGSGLLDSGGGMNPFTSAVVLGMVESGALEKNIRRLQETYTLRLEAMDTALRKYLPQAEFTTPGGGFFFWLRLPGVRTADFRPQARRLNADHRQGELFSSRQELSEYMRLSFCRYSPEEIEEGVKRLGESISG